MRVYALLIALLLCIVSFAQRTTNALHVGDQVPDIVFNNVVNSPVKKIKLSDYRGKLVILDMWSIFCTSCIAAFPKMENIQKSYNDKIQVLLVNPYKTAYDSKEKVIDLLERIKKRTGNYPGLPIPTEDTILTEYFPHRAVPHIVWIGSDGKVVAITNSNELNKENIAKVLAGERGFMSVKDDWGYNIQKPLYFEGNGGNPDNFLYRTLITGYNGSAGFHNGLRYNSKKEIVGFYILNTSLKGLIIQAYPEFFNGLKNNRVFLNVKNVDQYGTDFNPSYSYCYDLTIPPTNPRAFNSKKFLQDDLTRYFNINVSKQKRKMNCLIITPTEKIKKIASKSPTRALDLQTDTRYKFIHKFSDREVIGYLDIFNTPMVIDSKSSLEIDVDFPYHFDLTNQQAVIDFLKKTGFEVKEEERELNVVVISDLYL